MKPKTNKKCLSFMNCVSVCPKDARHYSKPRSIIEGQKLKKSRSERKENKLYI